MAVREFNGTSDDLVQNLGAATSQTFGTAAMLLKFSTVTSFRSLLQFNDSTYTFVSAPLDFTNFGTFSTFYSTGSDTGFSASTGIWYLVVIRKATGTTTPRYSVYNYNTSSWSHGNSVGGAEANGTATGAGGRSGFAFQGGGDFFGGRVAMRAAWSNSLPWTADASGDSALVAAGLHTSAGNWVAANPSVCWKYDQASTATAVTDISSGGTGTQISITGTTVINGDDPPGFTFTLAGASSPAVQQQYWPALRGGSWPRRQLPQSVVYVPPGTNAPADVATATGTAPFDSSGGSISLNLVADSPVTATGTAYDATVSTANATNASAGAATGTGTANAPNPKVAPGSGAATATGAAQAPSPSVKPGAGTATGTGAANSATSLVSTGPTAAAGTGTANNASVSTGSSSSANAGNASGTGTANDPSAAVAPGATTSTGTAAALNASGSTAPSPSTATATGTGLGATSKVSPGPTAATAAGTAFNATIQTGSFTMAQAGVAAATGTAGQASLGVSPSPAVAIGAGVGFNPSAGSSVNVAAGAATATGAAFDAAITRAVAALAGAGTATGSANGGRISIAPSPQSAVALAVALNALISGAEKNAESSAAVTDRRKSSSGVGSRTTSTPEVID